MSFKFKGDLCPRYKKYVPPVPATGDWTYHWTQLVGPVREQFGQPHGQRLEDMPPTAFGSGVRYLHRRTSEHRKVWAQGAR